MAHHEAPKKTGANNDVYVEEDGGADAFAAFALVAVIVCAVTFWLNGMA
jgi:hypothetical protein